MKRIEMIGTPLDHVRSPGILNPMFRAAGEAFEVVTTELGRDELAACVTRLRGDPGVAGLLVTTPLKQAITAYLDRRTDLVSFLGAANCVRCDGSGWFGANVDGHGFLAALRQITPNAGGKRVLIVGCGGAGSAIAAGLVADASPALRLFDTDGARAKALAEGLRRFAPGSDVDVIDAPAGSFDLVVNASPVGMHHGDPSPIPEETVAAAGIIADIVSFAGTRLKQTAAALGKPLVTGEAMVLGQAGLLRRFFLSDAMSEQDVLDASQA